MNADAHPSVAHVRRYLLNNGWGVVSDDKPGHEVYGYVMGGLATQDVRIFLVDEGEASYGNHVRALIDQLARVEHRRRDEIRADLIAGRLGPLSNFTLVRGVTDLGQGVTGCAMYITSTHVDIMGPDASTVRVGRQKVAREDATDQPRLIRWMNAIGAAFNDLEVP